MKLSQVAPLPWYRHVNRWTLSLSPWRYAALMASGTASGMAAGAAFGGAHVAEWLLLGTTNWLILLLVGRLVAPALLRTMRQQQQWREERRQSQAAHPPTG